MHEQKIQAHIAAFFTGTAPKLVEGTVNFKAYLEWMEIDAPELRDVPIILIIKEFANQLTEWEQQPHDQASTDRLDSTDDT